MSAAKNAAAEEAARKDPYARKAARYARIRSALATDLSNFVGFIEDNPEPCMGFTLSRRDEGGYLIVMKRVVDLEHQVMFARGLDIIDTLMEANGKLAAGEWRVNKPYVPLSS